MELRCVQSPAVSSIPRRRLIENPFLRGHTLINLPCNRRFCTDARRLKFLDSTARASGTTRAKATAGDTTPSNVGMKDKNLVFVAGATGKVGSRTVRELLKLGFKVRAGVRSTQRAQSLVQSVREMKLEDVAGGTQPIDKLELVECDLEELDRIKPAIANSSIVICCIGASEKEVLDITGPYRIDFQATKNLIDAATSAKVDHFILLTSLGTNKVGFPAAILNLFWGVLIWKRKAEEALLASGLPYTIVRPGGMERPTDSYKETHNITLSEEDTLFGGQVSNLQVAELLAFMAKNRSLSCCKVVEVIAETTAPLTPMGDLLKKIPSQREELCPPQESDDAEVSLPAVPETIVEKEPVQIKAAASTPLSPYIAYEDLKPPTSPTPTPSTGSVAPKASTIETVSTAAIPTPSLVEVNSLETSSIAVDSLIPQTAPKKQSPSSPYINYEDLKPPSSPTPTPSTGSSSATKAINADEITSAATSSSLSSTETDSSEKTIITIENATPQTAPKKTNPSSPYTNYEDLKPPSSPTPTPSGSSKEPSITPITSAEEASSSLFTVGNGFGTTSDVEKDRIETLEASNQSPYLVYDELKPPSSPSPNVPIVTVNNNPVNEKSSGDAINLTGPKATPLSPYTMYEDLKPPSSPVPSPKKF